MSRDPRISGIWASKSGMEESFNFTTCEIPKRSGPSIVEEDVWQRSKPIGVSDTRRLKDQEL
jgi:hypothetical protein